MSNIIPTTQAPTVSPEQQKILDDCIQMLKELDGQLDAEIPMLHTAMVRTNNYLRQFPDLIHLLTEEQIAPLYTAMVNNAELVFQAKKASKKGAATKERTAFTGDEDLFG